jgi:hypothetical protein
MITPWVCSGFDGVKLIVTVLIGHAPATSKKIGIEWRIVLIVRVNISTCTIALPNFN